MDKDEIKGILTKYKVVAVVGLSKEPEKDSYKVSAFLKQHGYRIIPVNPFADEVLGEKSYKNLLEIPPEIQKTIEIVDIFRPAKDVLSIVEQAAKIRQMYGKPFVIWMQIGIISDQAAEAARLAGFMVVMNKCLMIEYHGLL